MRIAHTPVGPIPQTGANVGSEYTPEEQAFLREVDAWRRKHRRAISVIETLRLAVAQGYCQMPFSATSEAGSTPPVTGTTAEGENASNGPCNSTNATTV